MKGAKWRKWDLHVQRPASQNSTGHSNQFIIQLGNADCDVIGIMTTFPLPDKRKAYLAAGERR
jgi:hypothetical protein